MNYAENGAPSGDVGFDPVAFAARGRRDSTIAEEVVTKRKKSVLGFGVLGF